MDSRSSTLNRIHTFVNSKEGAQTFGQPILKLALPHAHSTRPIPFPLEAKRSKTEYIVELFYQFYTLCVICDGIICFQTMFCHDIWTPSYYCDVLLKPPTIGAKNTNVKVNDERRCRLWTDASLIISKKRNITAFETQTIKNKQIKAIYALGEH